MIESRRQGGELSPTPSALHRTPLATGRGDRSPRRLPTPSLHRQHRLFMSATAGQDDLTLTTSSPSKARRHCALLARRPVHDAKNWQLVTSFVSDVNAHVTHIFVASPICARFPRLREDRRACRRPVNCAAELMAQPRARCCPMTITSTSASPARPGTTDPATNKYRDPSAPRKGGKSALVAHQASPTRRRPLHVK